MKAITSPLLEDVSIDGALGVLMNITCGPDLTIDEVSEAASTIQEAAHEDAKIYFGTVFDQEVGDEMRITVIATGIDARPGVQPVGDRSQGKVTPLRKSRPQMQQRPQQDVQPQASNNGGMKRSASVSSEEDWNIPALPAL